MLFLCNCSNVNGDWNWIATLRFDFRSFLHWRRTTLESCTRGDGLILPINVETEIRVFLLVHDVWVMECHLSRTEHHVVSSFDAEHAGMVLVADLVLPGSESATRPDALLFQVRQALSDSGVAVETGGGVAALKTTMIDGNDFVS